MIEYLRIARTLEPPTFTVLDPGENPDCAILESVRRDIEGSGICEAGGCGEGGGRWEEFHFRPNENSSEYLNAITAAERVLNAQQSRQQR